MKIDFYKAAGSYNTQAIEGNKQKSKETVKATSKDQDRIELSLQAKKITSGLAAKNTIMSELTKTDAAKLERISKAVAKGEYFVSSESIANAILGKSK